MAETINFELVSPEELLLSGEVLDVTVPGSEGEFGVFPRHAPFITTLKPGILKVNLAEGGAREIVVRGGFAEVGPEALTVLAEQATPVEEIDTAALEIDIRNAQDDVKDATDDDGRDKAQARLDQLRELQGLLARR